ncbi:hypothetical protein [Streptomyces erythrochromogenes]|uniref:hypothetical protein n=1 Tax=Streptomyces erythrochromogenes TaxID=285574 RepID=UPI0037FB801A
METPSRGSRRTRQKASGRGGGQTEGRPGGAAAAAAAKKADEAKATAAKQAKASTSKTKQTSGDGKAAKSTDTSKADSASKSTGNGSGGGGSGGAEKAGAGNADNRPNFASEAKAQQHFSNHVYGIKRTNTGFKNTTSKPDMPEYQTPDGYNEYVDDARTFMSGGPQKGDLIDDNKWLYRMDVKTGRFGVLNPAGEISTFFRREKDIVAYMKAQHATYGGSFVQ